ncbi:MAG: hypothetical protein AAFP00_14060, partial [Bacteroidota bacterium]
MTPDAADRLVGHLLDLGGTGLKEASRMVMMRGTGRTWNRWRGPRGGSRRQLPYALPPEAPPAGPRLYRTPQEALRGQVRGAGQAFKPLQQVSQSQAEAVAKALGGRFKGFTRNNNGYLIELGHPNRPTVVRLMNEGSGQRGQAYLRISKSGKGS